MARGRIITNEITKDKRVNELSSDTSRLAFTWLITFADVDGRTYGDPALVRSMIFPRRDDITIRQIEEFIQEWHNAGLVIWYEAQGDRWIYFPAFGKHQQVRRDREAPSHIPAPPESKPETEALSNITPELLQSNDGVMTEQPPLYYIKLNKESEATPPHLKLSANERKTLRSEIQKYFLVKTQLPAPRIGTKTEIKAAQRLWWTPIDEIVDLARGSPEYAREIIDRSLDKLRDVTVSDPNSIIKTARAVYAEMNGGKSALEGYSYA